jgi:hypothetical protein
MSKVSQRVSKLAKLGRRRTSTFLTLWFEIREDLKVTKKPSIPAAPDSLT